MRDVLREWTPREKYVKCQFPNTFSFVSIPGMFRQKFTEIRQFCISYEFTQNGCIPLRTKCEILAVVDKTRDMEHSGTSRKFRNIKKS